MTLSEPRTFSTPLPRAPWRGEVSPAAPKKNSSRLRPRIRAALFGLGLLGSGQGVAAEVADSVGAGNSRTGTFRLRETLEDGSSELQSVITDAVRGSIPIAGDWDGDGIATIGVYHRKSSTFRLRNRNTSGPAELQFRLEGAPPGLLPLAGDWDGDGRDTVGVYDPKTGQFRLQRSDNTGTDTVIFQVEGARKSWLPFAGDFDGDGITTVGLFEPGTGIFRLRNRNSNGPAEVQTQILEPADAKGWLPVAGDWDGDGITTIGRFHRPTGSFVLRNRNSDGPADLKLQLSAVKGRTWPVAGVWSAASPPTAARQCVDTINAYRATLNLAPLARWKEAEPCADGQAQSDAATGQPHGQFPACGERGQNECAGWSGAPEFMIDACLAMMWDEGPGTDFSQHGHYLNMSNPHYTEVACGFHSDPDGGVWSVQDFR